jgi:hypothetical protein
MVCAVECRMPVLHEGLRNLLPRLTPEQQAAMMDKRLGFEGISKDGMRYATLIPTPASPRYWIWSVKDIATRIEDYAPEGMACSRIPWTMFRDMTFAAVPMNATWKYPPSVHRPRRQRLKHLYIIQAVAGGPVKIGVSDEPQGRVVQLQPGNPYPLQVIRVYEAQGKSERAVHKTVRHLRLQGEWFEEAAVEVVDALMEEKKHD